MKIGKSAGVRVWGSAFSALALCVSTVVAAPSVHAQNTVAWGNCNEIVGSGMQEFPGTDKISCTTVTVPVDYAQPEGRSTQIAVSRILPSSGHSGSTIVGHPGGPGSDTLLTWAPRGLDASLPDVAAHHTLIAVQPRGLRGSNPLNCAANSRSYALNVGGLYRACSATDAQYLRSMTTENAARDINAVRQALGLSSLDFMAQSYGTVVAATYGTLFPAATGRMVLDSSVHPQWMWNEQVAKSSWAQARRINDIFQWIADNNDTYQLGTTPRQVFRKWENIVNQEVGGGPNLTPPPATAADLPPMLAGTALEPLVLGALKATDPFLARFVGVLRRIALLDSGDAATGLLRTTVSATTSQASWPQLANVIAVYSRGERIPRVDPLGAKRILDDAPLQPLSDQSMFEIVTCNETSAPSAVLPSLGSVGAASVDEATGGNRILREALEAKAGKACAGYPATSTPVSVDGAALAHRPLVVHNVRDTLTPLAGGVAMAAKMGGYLVTVDAGDHLAYRNNMPWVDDAVTAYLSHGEFPDSALAGPAAPVPAAIGNIMRRENTTGSASMDGTVRALDNVLLTGPVALLPLQFVGSGMNATRELAQTAGQSSGSALSLNSLGLGF